MRYCRESGNYCQVEAFRADRVVSVLALFTVGDVYASLCKRGAYAPFCAQRRSRALLWL